MADVAYGAARRQGLLDIVQRLDVWPASFSAQVTCLVGRDQFCRLGSEGPEETSISLMPVRAALPTA